MEHLRLYSAEWNPRLQSYFLSGGRGCLHTPEGENVAALSTITSTGLGRNIPAGWK